jgi:serine/threonine protein kinase
MENYHVLEQIGEGSFGKVFKGRRKCSPETVAMKFIPKHGKTEKDLKSLRQEIGILSNLSHPNIIKMIEYFETKTEFCVVTEYAHGELFEILEDDGKPPHTALGRTLFAFRSHFEQASFPRQRCGAWRLSSCARCSTSTRTGAPLRTSVTPKRDILLHYSESSIET